MAIFYDSSDSKDNDSSLASSPDKFKQYPSNQETKT